MARLWTRSLLRQVEFVYQFAASLSRSARVAWSEFAGSSAETGNPPLPGDPCPAASGLTITAACCALGDGAHSSRPEPRRARFLRCVAASGRLPCSARSPSSSRHCPSAVRCPREVRRLDDPQEAGPSTPSFDLVRYETLGTTALAPPGMVSRRHHLRHEPARRSARRSTARKYSNGSRRGGRRRPESATNWLIQPDADRAASIFASTCSHMPAGSGGQRDASATCEDRRAPVAEMSAARRASEC